MNRLFYISLFLIISVTELFSQSLSVLQFTSDDGLPQNTAESMILDRKGVMWIATEVGVVAYDGVKFRTVNTTNGLIHNHVKVIFEDSKYNLWFGTLEGLSKYNGKTFTNYSYENGLKNNYIVSITEDKDGSIFVATEKKGIARLYKDTLSSIDGDGQRRTTVKDTIVHLTKNDGLPADTIGNKCFVDSRNNLWIASLSAGLILKKKDSTIVFNSGNGLPGNEILSLDEDSQGNLWVGLRNYICRYDGENFKSFRIRYKYNEDVIVTFIFEDKNKNLWIGSTLQGLFLFNGEEFEHYSTERGLPSNQIIDCIEDSRGDLWFGTRNGGMFKVPAERFMIYSEENGLAYNVVYGIYKDRRGALWFGHEGFGVTRVKGNEYTNFTTESGLSSDMVPTITGDSQGNVWIGSLIGAVKYTPQGEFVQYGAKDGLYDPFNDPYVISITEDSDGNIWFGGRGGVSFLDKEMGKIIVPEIVSELMPDEEFVWKIYEDYDGFIWLAAYGAGAMKLNKTKFIRNYTEEDGLPNNLVLYIMQDKFGNFWFCNEDGGITRFDGENFRTFTKKDGLASNTCYVVAEHLNYLYIGTNQGISRFAHLEYEEKGKDAFKNYTARDGLSASEINTGAVFKDEENNLYFGTQKGVTVYNPKNRAIKKATPIYINNMRIIEDQTVIDTLPSGNMELMHTQNNIRFDFSGVSFVDPEKIIYRYKLEGADNTWTISNEHSVTYRALDANEYKFRVLCQNADGIWSEKEAAISFVITPPFWETWWFYSISIIFSLTFITGFYRYKTYQVKKRNIELAETVRFRTKELEEEKDKSESLLQNILPSSLVDELKHSGSVEPREFKNSTILFTDFKGFTYTASVLPAARLVNELNEIFESFDEVIEKYGLEKLKTIGDSYMAAGGLPEENEDHAILTIKAAMEMQKIIKHRNEISAIKWEMRCGLHSGQVIAGVVGTKKFTYDIWGDTVNIASRMESSGEPGEINISAYTYMLVKDYFHCEYRGKVDAKGKGKIDMYFVRGIKEEFEAIQLNSLKI